MDEVSRRDRSLLIRECASPSRVILSACAILASIAFWQWSALWAVPLIGIVHFATAKNAAFAARFASKRFEALWVTCQDRLRRLDSALRSLKRHRIADLTELPATIDVVASNLYRALRRADIVQQEIERSELAIPSAPRFTGTAADPQTQELLKIADRNVAEYKQHLNAVSAGVRIAEAQAAVFATTLDTLRVRMLGYRLADRRPEQSSAEFLASLVEAKMQLSAIDRALDELEAMPFPQTIAVLPDEPAPGAGT